MPTFYLGTTTDGRVVSRKSNRNDFTHAAMQTAGYASSLPNFSTSRAGAEKLMCQYWSKPEHRKPFEVVELRKVDAAEFHKANKGLDPKTGRPRATA